MLRFLTAGESHGPELLVIVEGMPAGVEVRDGAIDRQLARRQQGYGRGARSTKIERDHAEVIGGLAGGRTTGAPVGIRIVNRDFANQPAEPRALTAPRPGHADLAGGAKYGVRDYRLVRERASARETAARVAAGAVVGELLTAFGVSLGSFVTAIGDAAVDRAPGWLGSLDGDALLALASDADESPVRCPEPSAADRMITAIDAARSAGETLGGTFVVFAAGVPIGLGSHVHWDRKLDGLLAGAVCSIPAVKGAEIGAAFDLATRPGTETVDAVAWDGAAVERTSNHAGGLEGGVTNGQPIVIRAAMKPLSSVRSPVPSVDFETGAPADPGYVRSDVCAVPAAAVVGEAMVAWVLAQAAVERFGGDRLVGMIAARDALAGTDLPRTAAPTPEP